MVYKSLDGYVPLVHAHLYLSFSYILCGEGGGENTLQPCAKGLLIIFVFVFFFCTVGLEKHVRVVLWEWVGGGLKVVVFCCVLFSCFGGL